MAKHGIRQGLKPIESTISDRPIRFRRRNWTGMGRSLAQGLLAVSRRIIGATVAVARQAEDLGEVGGHRIRKMAQSATERSDRLDEIASRLPPSEARKGGSP